jgi:quercetin dioxygenase-like cupin family protein
MASFLCRAAVAASLVACAVALHAQQAGSGAAQPLVLRQAELMAGRPALQVPGEVRVWPMRRDAHSRTNLVEFSGRSPLHSHPDADHTLMVLQGTVWVRAGAEEVKLEVGDFISIPPLLPHAYWVQPGTKALLVSFDAPPYDEKKTVWHEPRGR